MCFIVTSGNFVLMFQGLRRLHENKRKQLDDKASELEKERLMCGVISE